MADDLSGNDAASDAVTTEDAGAQEVSPSAPVHPGQAAVDRYLSFRAGPAPAVPASVRAHGYPAVVAYLRLLENQGQR